MARKETSARVASEAAKVLRDKNESKIDRSIAGSALSQRERHKRKKK